MEACSALSLSSPKTHLLFNLCNSPHSSSSSSNSKPFCSFSPNLHSNIHKSLTFSSSSKNSFFLSQPHAVADALEAATETSNLSQGAFSKIDNGGRFGSPRAARELALLVAYAACLEGSDPVLLLDKRVNAKRVPGYIFDKASLLQYDHMSFGGEPVQVETEEEAEELRQKNEKDSIIEAEVLSAPPKLVYNKFVLRLARDLLVAVVNQWNEHVLIIEKIIPQNWKDEPSARILELCILHLAMAEITALGTRHQIVINEAVDLTKRFCDGSAPRIVNGCLRTFIKHHNSRISTV
ncbi:uncharacterized protein LOC110022543 isoform X2 [Phalaenopsis equestris]|uniref:uncharacterized protein LOC110022543 isoform X2 n=1 Tax=Phalaenopsis equestris TaxID=78828 RepID=UPI0009E65837|nr:uncharacterized protein LOC110022543 isoform X2 [Phalaenopsis equestris]